MVVDEYQAEVSLSFVDGRNLIAEELPQNHLLVRQDFGVPHIVISQIKIGAIHALPEVHVVRIW